MAQAAEVRLILAHIAPNLANNPVVEKGIGDQALLNQAL